MPVMELKEYKDCSILNKLKQEEDCPKMLLTITNFAFSKMVQNLMHQLDSEFESKRGRPAYPRTLILIVVFLLIVTCGLKPSRNSFANFLNKSDAKVIKKVFISTLVLLNDLHFLDFVKLFVDGTDAIVRASRNNKITPKEVERLKLMNKWNLLHNNTPKSINHTIEGLEEKLEFYKNDEEMCKTINSILKRINLYNTNIFNKLDIYSTILNERNIGSVSVSFPEACWMKTKKGIYDFAFNLQEIMTENHIILTGMLLTQSNDWKTIKEVLKNIYETIDLFIKMQREFGERRNYSEIQKRIREHILIADSGYFSTENLYHLFINKINALVMPKKLSEDHNNSLRRENGYKEKRKKSTKKDFIRVKNGYICPFGRFMRLVEVKKVKRWKPHKEDTFPDICKTKKYIFKTYSCKGCPNIENCKHQRLVIHISDLIYEMTEKFLNKRYKIHYKARFSRSEGINGFLKGDNGVLKLIGTTENAVNNEIQLRNTIYNLTRLINLKDTAY